MIVHKFYHTLKKKKDRIIESKVYRSLKKNRDRIVEASIVAAAQIGIWFWPVRYTIYLVWGI